MNIVLLFFFVAAFAILIRLFMLQIVHHRTYSNLAAKQHSLVKELSSERGLIFLRDKKGELIPLAFNKTWKTLIAAPKEIENPEEASSFLAKVLERDHYEIAEKLSKKNDPHEIIAKKIDEPLTEKIEKRGIKGIFFEEEKRRLYPQGTMAAHAVGFVSKEVEGEKGRYGLERFYDRELAGEKGFFEGAKDAAGFWIAIAKRIVKPPKNGANLALTLDYNIQLKTEEVLKKIRGKWEASSGNILVLDPKTGRILALAAEPVFDPNEFAKEKDFSIFLNPVIESRYELGSVLKPITMAAGLEEGLVKPETTYNDYGEIKFGSYTIRNFDGKAYYTQTMNQVLEKSLNTGAVYVARLLKHEKHLDYLERFGLNKKTGVDFPGEIAGDLSNLKSGRDINFATASFGQGIAVTPLELAVAIGAIANGGQLMKPHIVEKIIDENGSEKLLEPEVRGRVISKETAETLTKMLISAVRNGFENRAGIKGYFVAGKTGTAQVPRREGRGYSDKVIHTFVGYAPAFDPKFLILLQLNEPKGNRFAANTLTPAFHDLAQYILNYYEVPPDEK